MGVTFQAPRAPLEESIDPCPVCSSTNPDPECSYCRGKGMCRYAERAGTIHISAGTARAMLEILGVSLQDDEVVIGSIPYAEISRFLRQIQTLRHSRRARSKAWRLEGVPEHLRDTTVVWGGYLQSVASLCYGCRSDYDVLRYLDDLEHLLLIAQRHQSDVDFS